MQFKLTIDVDNDAFQPDPRLELTAILTDCIRKLKESDEYELKYYQNLIDSRGNIVGRFAIKPE